MCLKYRGYGVKTPATFLQLRQLEHVEVKGAVQYLEFV